MTPEKFARRSQIIAQHLSTIMRQSCQAGSAGALQMSGPQFHQVVSAQERLLNAVEQFLETHQRG